MSFHALMEARLEKHAGESLSESHPLGHEIDQFADHDAHGFKGFVESLGTWAKEHPGKILTALHALRPVLNIKSVTVATSYEAVKDILGRDGDFAVTYGPKMEMITQGAGFFLGMDDDQEKGFSARTNMLMLFRRDDIESLVKPLIDRLAQQRLAQLKPGFDLVADYLKLLPAEFAIRYFGLRQIEPALLHQWTAGLFDYLFIDVTDNPVVGRQAEEFAEQLRDALDQEIATATPSSDTVIGRGITLHKAGIPGFDPVNLRNNVIGLLIGLVPTTAKSAAMAYDYATHTPESARAFFDFHESHDFPAFNAYVRELTRLNPINPGLFRKAVREATVISGGKAFRIPENNLIFVGTFTAMRDNKHLPQPLQIMPGRPDSAYLTYGYGLHACFGRYINDLHVSSLLYHCFQAGHWQRADGDAGNLVFDGAFPSHLKMKA